MRYEMVRCLGETGFSFSENVTVSPPVLPSACQGLALSSTKRKIKANCSPEKSNIRLQDLIPISRSGPNISFKDICVRAANQRDAHPDHQASYIVMVDFSGIDSGPWISLLKYCENN
ncbi:hypothetical protein TNCV_4395631 [Trichonephila clavipes]|uniref:Uncharacterized protein n=1 Tax=Trichonephila clavipes TaxID=2585209 RepID=A0A8X6W5A4_TRICX|nr:hypothetical protein TNCV_4395631 [Trichonephila clavipes]